MRSSLLASALAAALVLVPTAAWSATIGGESLSSPGVVVQYGPDAKPLPKVSARSWVLARLETNDVLAAKNAHWRSQPASTLKTLTAITLMPQLDPDAEYLGKPSDGNVDGSRIGIAPGQRYTVNDLWHALFLPSANDAAVALAHANGGVKKTLTEMNAEAQRIQALDTVAKGPNGLDHPGQTSSAYDLALIAKTGLAMQYFKDVASTKTYDFPMGNSTLKIYNQNRLLQHGYKGTIGVKTGYTTGAGRTFVAAATRNGVTLVVSLMKIGEWSEDAARKLLDWGFANYDKVQPVGTLVDPVSTERASTDVSPVSTDAGSADGQDLSASGSTPAGSLSAFSPITVGVLAAIVLLVVVVIALAVRSSRHHSKVRGAHAARRTDARTRRSDSASDGARNEA